MGETYAGAGVDIAAGDEAVARIAALVGATHRPEVRGGFGGFSGLYDISTLGRRRPLLAAATDGVGTKAMVATMTGRFDTIGIDLVAMCVDDLVCVGAEPLFFLDYISVGTVEPDLIEALVRGVVEGCRTAGCALVGGETAEHPGTMAPGEFDLVGFAVGAVEADAALDGRSVVAGDVVVGLASPGLRSNGYTLARRLFFDVGGRSLDDPAHPGSERSVGEELLLPSVIYARGVIAALEAGPVHAIAHITGGGLPGNLARVLPPDVDLVIDRGSWRVPPVFTELQRIGDVAEAEMERVFNLGVGMVLVVPPTSVEPVRSMLGDRDIESMVIGEVTDGTGRVHLLPPDR